MQNIVLIVFVLTVALSVTVQSRLLTWLEAMEVHSGIIFLSVTLGAALIPVMLFAFAIVFFSRNKT